MRRGTKRRRPLARPPEILPTDSVQEKLEKLRQIAEQADYTGMSYKEIYTAIWDRYNAAFDGNMPAITTPTCIPDPNAAILNQFLSEVHCLVTYPMQQKIQQETGLTPGKQDYNEYIRSRYGSFSCAALGYEDMTLEEREQAILEKYAGKDTLQDVLNRTGELILAGVLDYTGGADTEPRKLSPLDKHMYNTCYTEWGLSIRDELHPFSAGLRKPARPAVPALSFSFDAEGGAKTKCLDDLLTALGKRDAERLQAPPPQEDPQPDR